MREILIMLGAAAVFLASVGAQAAGLIRGEVEVTGDQVTLGDIFYGLGERRDRPVAQAPAPGESLQLDSQWLRDAARRHDVDWRPASRDDSLTITRKATFIEAPALRQAIGDALAERQAGDTTMKVRLNNRSARLAVDADSPATVRVVTLDKRPYSERFDARLVAPAEGKAEASITVSGRAEALVQLPVLASRLERGEVIAASDLTTIERRERRVRDGAIRQQERLVGQELTRSIRAQRPVRERDIQTPRLVEEGDTVILALRDGGLNLTAKGTALEAGAQGQQVTVRNKMSNNTVTGKVTAQGRVAVAMPGSGAGS